MGCLPTCQYCFWTPLSTLVWNHPARLGHEQLCPLSPACCPPSIPQAALPHQLIPGGPTLHPR